MRKTYPYLQNVYSPDLNDEQQKRYFLSYIDEFVNQRQYVKITLLNWEEKPIKDLEGEITGGSISKDGTSTVRRTCNLSCTVDGNSYNADDMNMDFSLNKKVFIELGVKNDSPYYKEYPILWFPQGVFFITSFSMNSSSSSSVNLSLGLKDKMALLNGEIGGTFTSTVQLDVMSTQKSTGETIAEQKVLIYDLIRELVHHWGGEDLNNIIIEDVPLRIRKIMRWIGEDELYGTLSSSTITSSEQWNFSLSKPSSNDITYYTFQYGEDVGYIYSDFVVTKELIANAGDNVCSILDQIKNLLGNYEYFYDEMGIFHFREIKNFLNVTQAELVLDEMSENDYFIETTNEKAIYSFSDNTNLTSITATPLYENIKNDYVVYGLRKGTSDDSAIQVMYHLVIDKKPEIEGSYRKNDTDIYYYGKFECVAYYTDPIDGLNKLTIPEGIYIDEETKRYKYTYETFNDLPKIGNNNKHYYVEKDKKIYYWNETKYDELTYQEEKTREKSLKDGTQKTEKYTDYHSLSFEENNNVPKNTEYTYATYYAEDWRTFLYLKGLVAQNAGTDEGPYFQELDAFWPREYELLHDNQNWQTVVTADAQDKSNAGFYTSFSTIADGNYFLDFLDVDSELSEYSVSSIGSRRDIINDEDINCLFEAYIPNIIFLNIDDPSLNMSENTVLYDDQGNKPKTNAEMLATARQFCHQNDHPYTQVHNDIYSNLAIGGYMNSAYEKIRYELFLHSNFQKSISITSLPVFYLEPNSRVTLNDKSTNTYGDYIVKNINLTLGPGANMATSLTEVRERL